MEHEGSQISVTRAEANVSALKEKVASQGGSTRELSPKLSSTMSTNMFQAGLSNMKSELPASEVRQSRRRLEEDVLKMQTRIGLL